MICPCGAKLLSRWDCLESGDEVLRHVGLMYLDDESGYCIEEDDVVPFAWAFKMEAQRLRQLRMGRRHEPFGS